MVGLIHQYQLKAFWIEFFNAVLGYNALHACDSDVCGATRMDVAHFNIDALCRVCINAVLCCLLDEFLAMGQDEGLIRTTWQRFNAIDELGKDDLGSEVSILPTAR